MFFKKDGGVTWLAVFLGNPGSEYENTRHNAGFMTAQAAEELTGARINRAKFKSLTARCTLGGQSVLMMKPQTYMNLSGEAVAEAARFYKIPPERVIVVSDETALAPGRIRVRASGSAGGHNGLKSIISSLGSESFPRVRLGVGAPPHPDWDMKDWVLGRPDEADMKLIRDAASRAARAVECYIAEGAERAMNKFNQNVK